MSFIKALIFAGVAFTGTPEIPEPPEKPPVQQTGISTTYGLGGFHGDTMANGEAFKPKKEITCAHKSIPLGTVIYVESVDSGNMISCRITDRGPYTVEDADGDVKPVTPAYELKEGESWVRILDMSVKASKALGEWGHYDVRLRYWGVRPDRNYVYRR